MKYIFIFIAAFIGISILAIALNIITIPWLRLNTKVEMERDIVRKTYDADNALYNYRWFKDRYEALIAQKRQIAIAENSLQDFQESAGPRENWTFEDKAEEARLRAVVQGLRTDYEQKVGEYNSRMKQTDRSLFSEDLPLIFEL